MSLVPNSNIVGLARLKIVAAPYCVCRYIYRQWQWECRLVQMESAPALPKISAYCHLGPVVVDRASSIGCAPPLVPRLADVPLPTLPAYASAHPLAAPIVQYIILLKYNQPSIKCSGRYVQYVSSSLPYMQTERWSVGQGEQATSQSLTLLHTQTYIQQSASIIYYVLVQSHLVMEDGFFA